MQIFREGTRTAQAGPAEFFTGEVRLDILNTAPEPSRVACASVTFQPGARTAWHTHPLGQTLIVTSRKICILVSLGPAYRRTLSRLSRRPISPPR